MNIADLAAELTTDPIGLGYAGMTAAEACAALNTANRPGAPKELTPQEVLDAFSASELAGVADSSASETPVPQHTAAQAWDYYCAYATTIQVTTGTQGGDLLDGLVAQGIIGADTLAAVRAAAATTISRAEELGLGATKVGYVEQARAM